MQRSLIQLQLMWVRSLDCGLVANNLVLVADNVGSYAVLVKAVGCEPVNGSNRGLFYGIIALFA
jgi:hypothetical protein